MRSFPTFLPPASAQERKVDMDNIVYLVKRPGYEFILTTARSGSYDLKDGSEGLHVRFHRRYGDGGILTFEQLKDFYESLSQLMEYVDIEREKSSSEGVRSPPDSSRPENVAARTLVPSPQATSR